MLSRDSIIRTFKLNSATLFILLFLATKSSAKLHLHGSSLWFFDPRQSSDTVSDKAPSFLIKDKTGKTLDVADQRGKVVFLNFWALSCAPCKAEMPSINELAKHFKSNTNVLIYPVDVDNSLAISGKYMSEKGFILDVFGIASPVPQLFFQGQIPTTVVIDKNGKMVLFHEGQDDYGTAEFISFIEGLIK